MDKFLVSARKYRPTSFETVVGQQALTETLQNAIRSGRVAHAYLFCGPRGVGKTTCARIFAKAINCQNPTADFDACNECESCRAFNENRSMNIHELDAASNNSVDAIRSLMEETRIPPQIGKYKVFIIDEVHMLSSAAFNAFLKTLEEPPSYAVFILATTEKHKVLPTILSRCQVFDFARMTTDDTVRHLASVAAKEGIQVTEEALNVVAQKADGGMRDAMSIFDQMVTFCGNNITYEQAISVLNVLDVEYYFRMTDALLNGDITSTLLLLNEVLSKGFDGSHFLSGYANHVRNLLVSKDAATVELIEASEAIRKHFVEQAARCQVNWLLKVLDIVATADFNYRTARSKRLTIELALLRSCSLGQPAANAPLAPAPAAPAPVKAPVAAAPVAAAPVAAAPAPAPARPVVAAPVAATPAPAPARPVAAAPTAASGVPSVPSIPSIPTVPSVPAAPQSGPVAPPEHPVGQPTVVQQSQNFTTEQLISAWGMLRQVFPDDRRFASMLTNLVPRIVAMPQCEVVLMNELQERELRAKMPQILRHMCLQLHNDMFALNLRVEEESYENQAFSQEDKIHMLANENPVLHDLINTLELQLV